MNLSQPRRAVVPVRAHLDRITLICAEISKKLSRPPVSTNSSSCHECPRPTGAHDAATTVYHYHNLQTGDHLASLLPPDHPRWSVSSRVVMTRRLSLASSVSGGGSMVPAWCRSLPLDRRVVCKRCGLLIDDGVCG
ncbi:hypothetical protein EDD16DRAFT_711914 [Pisolithus croceorrhizus]|nr:hypothetical protein EDD16DRAFT_711914 [Pisolithus croceorrhizus]